MQHLDALFLGPGFLYMAPYPQDAKTTYHHWTLEK
jgi:hypothetical protein